MNVKRIISIRDKKFEPMISRDKIDSAVRDIASRINSDYQGKNPLFLVVLKGAVFFACDLLRNIDLDCTMEMISAKSYGDSMESAGKVRIRPESLNIKGKDVIIIEDIIDTGLTMKTLMERLKKLGPASVEAASLLSKPMMRKVDVDVKYIAIEIPSVFVVGYGLDFAEHGRQLPEIYGPLQ